MRMMLRWDIIHAYSILFMKYKYLSSLAEGALGTDRGEERPSVRKARETQSSVLDDLVLGNKSLWIGLALIGHLSWYVL